MRDARPAGHTANRLSPRAAAVVALAVCLVPALGIRSAGADNVPTITISDVTLSEGSTTTSFPFRVALTQAATVPVSVLAYTSDGTAMAENDYVANQALLSFAPGETAKTFTVQVTGDQRPQGDRRFYVHLGNESGAIVESRLGTGTIVDDDNLPYVGVEPTTVTEGTSTVNATFTARLSEVSAQTVRVRYYTSDGSARAGVDYLATTGTLKFAAGQDTATIKVAIPPDATDNGVSKYFHLNLRDPVNATTSYGGATAIGTIVDDDSTSRVSVSDVTVTEGNSGTTAANFVVTAYPVATAAITVDYATADGTATVAGGDYQAARGTLSFAPGDTSKTVTVAVNGDAVHENATEQFSFNLSNITNASSAPSDNSGLGVIVDDDAPVASVLPSISMNDISLVRPALGSTGHALLTARLSAPSAATVSATYATANSTAVAGTDYTGTTGTISFPAGTTTATIDVPVIGSAMQYPDRWFYVNLSSPANATLLDGIGSVVIVTQNVNPTAWATNPVVREGTGGATTATFVVNLSAASQNTVSVKYATVDGSATQPADYAPASGTLTFTPGQAAKAVQVAVATDSLDEGNQTFVLRLSTPTNVSTPETDGVAVIVDDDIDPTMSVADTTVVEGTGTNTTASFAVTLSAPSLNVVSAKYSTSDWSAVAPDDYVAQAGTLTFAPGETAKRVEVPVVGDTIENNVDQRFSLNLSTPVNATIVTYQATARIIDDDLYPWVSVRDTSVVRPTSGSADLQFAVVLTSASLNTVTVNYSTADGTATQPRDYSATNGTLTFAPGQTSLTVSVPVLGGTLPGTDRRLSLNLSSPTNATMLTSSATGVIVNPVLTPRLWIGATTVQEGNSGTTNSAVFPVTLSPPSPNQVTVDYRTANGTAVQPGDYTSTAGTLTFAPGQTQATVSVPVVGNTADTADKTFYVNLSNPVNATVVTFQAAARILDDDPSPSSSSYVSVGDAAVAEGDSGSADASFVVTVSPPSASPVSVSYGTSAPSWMVNQLVAQNGTVTFQPGETAKTVKVPVNGDTVAEGDQTFSLGLSDVSGASYLRSSGTGVILDDDALPYATISDASVLPGTTGAKSTVVVSLTAPSPQPFSVDWATADGTARDPGDYADDGGTVVIPAGKTTAAITVQVKRNVGWEPVESFGVDLANPVGATLLGYRGTVVVRNDVSSAITGTALDGNAQPIAGVTMTLAGNAQPTVSVKTDASGAFSITNVPDGIYTLKPTAKGITFVPSQIQVAVVGQTVNVPVLGVKGAFISGRVTSPTGDPMAGVTVIRSGGGQATTSVQTNAAGYYGLSFNPAGTYDVIPSLTGRSFSPTSASVTVASAGVTDVNFQAT